METRQMLGAILILLGVAGLLFATNIIPLTTVKAIPVWYYVYPSGTADNPDMVTPGIEVTLRVGIRARQIPEPYPEVTCTIEGTTITLSYIETNYHGRDEYGDIYVHYFEGSWNVPNEYGKLFELNWKADWHSPEYAVETLTTYAKTSEAEEPDGYFTINGLRAEVEGTIYLGTKTLTYEFIVTKNPDKIYKVWVEVIKKSTGAKVDSFELSKVSSDKYSITRDLPDFGTYEVKGYVVPTWDTSQNIRKMSILAVWGKERPPQQLPLTILSLCSVVAGAVLLTKKRLTPFS